MATLRAGEVWIGGMPGSRKLVDLRRDGRVAVHSGSDDPAGDGSWTGDAKFSGIAVEVSDPAVFAEFAGAQQEMPPGAFELFRVDVLEVSVVRVGDPQNISTSTCGSRGKVYAGSCGADARGAR